VLNLITFGMIVVVQLRMLMEIRPMAYVGMLLLVLAGVAAGWLLGGSAPGNRTAMAMVTSVRNVGVTTVVATGSFAGTAAVTAATAFAVFQTVVMALIALAWGRVLPSTDQQLSSVSRIPARRDEADFERSRDATTSSIEAKYGEEEQRRLRSKDARIDRADS
jgi:hypothetical protein